jgi:hypothetical protein
MKLDCEGAEWAIFRDAEAFVSVWDLRMEYHLTEGRGLDNLRAAANRLGFEIAQLRERRGFGIAYMSNRRTSDRVTTKSQEVL